MMAATIRQALQHPSLPLAETQMLLGHLIGCNRAWLITHEQDLLPTEIEPLYLELLNRRQHGEPMAYLVGQRPFFEQDLLVGLGVLIPRPETELLVEAALARCPAQPARILDLGTGSGCIAIALGHRRPDCTIIAVEKSSAALAYAAKNCAAQAAHNVMLSQGHWFSGLADQSFEIIVSNPPYIAKSDPHLQQGDLRFEPLSALAAGEDGLDDLRSIIGQAPRYLRTQGWLLVEHGYQQDAECRQLFAAAGFQAIETLRDLADHPRVTLGQIPGLT